MERLTFDPSSCRPNPPSKGKNKILLNSPFKSIEGQNSKSIYICDSSAVQDLEKAHADSPKGVWALEHSEDEVLYMCSSDILEDHLTANEYKSVTWNLNWKIWKALAGADLATLEVIDTVLEMTGVTADNLQDRSVYKSIVAVLQAQSASDPLIPRGLRHLVTSNERFWELFYSTEEKRERLRWALETVGGGRQLIPVEKLWKLHGT